MVAPLGTASLLPAPPTAPLPEPLDETAESLPDTAALTADEFSRHVVVALIAEQTRQQDAQLELDRMKNGFNQSQQEQAELLREMNALRDMALEQAKKDDEVLKKYISMI